jgi:hypothetical protein
MATIPETAVNGNTINNALASMTPLGVFFFLLSQSS